jgi:hypothetical protein
MNSKVLLGNHDSDWKGAKVSQKNNDFTVVFPAVYA